MPWPHFTSEELEALGQLFDEDTAAHAEFVDAFHSDDLTRLRAALSELDRTHQALRQYVPIDDLN